MKNLEKCSRRDWKGEGLVGGALVWAKLNSNGLGAAVGAPGRVLVLE